MDEFALRPEALKDRVWDISAIAKLQFEWRVYRQNMTIRERSIRQELRSQLG